MTRLSPRPDAALRIRLAAAETALTEALELIADLNAQLTRANAAGVRMAKRARIALHDATRGRAA
jgi:hypothetical protein